MNLVNLELAAKAYHEHVLLDRVSLGVSAGQRIGVVGRNGAGKTTLLAALAGTERLDSGRATKARDITIGYLPQAEQLTGSVNEVVLGGVAEHEWAADSRSRSVVEALLGGIDLTADVRQLSGGERRRTALAALLRRSYDLLLLDEPTNHLDIEAINWLAGYLKQYETSYVIVTHDRWFLDAVTEETWELADGQVHAYDGGYSAYVLAKAERTRLAAALDQRRRNLMRKELAWLRRGPPARTSKPKFRIEAATALIADEPPARDSVELSRLATTRLGKTVLELEDVSVTAGDRLLLSDVSWQLGPGDRVGIVGVNGTGKTTLLRLLSGDLPVPEAGPVATTGQVIRGSTVQLGYLTQEPPAVDPHLRVLEAAERVRGSAVIGKRELSASQLLERLGLRGERQWTRVGELSGGERRRLQLLLIMLSEPNVLLLDEPTNDLDIETLTELEDLLDGWPGSVVVVSHDRYFLERVTDHALALVGNELAFLPGGIDEYLSIRERAVAAGGPGLAGQVPGGPKDSGSSPASGPAAGGSGADRASADRPSAAQQRAGQKELTRLERQIARLTDNEARLHADLAGSASDYARLLELGEQLRALEAERSSLEERWLEVAEELGG
ncbi:MAG TPA: ABC-F family ATP-binding cassette domain-containing protein [Streptosporangiaceae bacterium]|nr:ABC-F family ATP-binding cassette domain-containing protein [Streptosporangiaceae bacterium]